ncbi:hypothetical protein B0T26DRAFT_681057 [Lasiosphaeria miniovina]|uniref:Uncharacterized protein n=1 Tax=Lasiosphaeria miniovina TaxID=1954250 RepID=A0AA39ZTN7_9PEZI|nr:uncharacterized protein B0T26DRAFT_681057 [Lasiosphaeria miniovina]KAK0703373.1 hypothetical protein B0T26DRAFT_681057 [Lasiosphaeria miniovina]
MRASRYTLHILHMQPLSHHPSIATVAALLVAPIPQTTKNSSHYPSLKLPNHSTTTNMSAATPTTGGAGLLSECMTVLDSVIINYNNITTYIGLREDIIRTYRTTQREASDVANRSLDMMKRRAADAQRAESGAFDSLCRDTTALARGDQSSADLERTRASLAELVRVHRGGGEVIARVVMRVWAETVAAHAELQMQGPSDEEE